MPLRVRPGECAVLASSVRYCHTCGWGGLAGTRAARDAPLLLWCAQFSPAPVLDAEAGPPGAEAGPPGAARRRSPTPVALAVPCAATHPALRPAPRGAGAPLSARNGVRVLPGSAVTQGPCVAGQTAGQNVPGAEPGQFLPLARPGDCALVRGLEWHCRCVSSRPPPPLPPVQSGHVSSLPPY